jgi:putative ABC transport system substrate-binding protein
VWEELRASRIPVVFNAGDPIRQGLVASFNRPGGTFTGVYTLGSALTGKILQMMRDLVPGVMRIGLIVNFIDGPAVPDAREAAAKLGLQLVLLDARSPAEIENTFATLNERRVGAIHVMTSPFFLTQAKLFVDLAARYRIPVVYPRRLFVDAGGLMSYSFNVAESYRVMGNYTGRILKGTSPADLPVSLPTTFEFVINLKTAKALGLTVPPTLLAIADEIIE